MAMYADDLITSYAASACKLLNEILSQEIKCVRLDLRKFILNMSKKS